VVVGAGSTLLVLDGADRDASAGLGRKNNNKI
jgi:hypothetical protein